MTWNPLHLLRSSKAKQSSKRLFKRFYPTFEQLEIRWLPSITSAVQRVTDPFQSALQNFGTAAVAPNTGGVRLVHPLDFDKSPGTSVGRNPAMVYDSETVGPRPIIEVILPTVSGSGLPTSLEGRLTFNGTTQSWISFSTSGHSAGDTYVLALEADTAVTATGAYSWTVNTKIHYTA